MGEPCLHHIGHVVSSIEQSIEGWFLALNAVTVSEIIEDPIQRVRAVFIGLPPEAKTQFELVESMGSESPIHAFAQKGGGLHHLCFEVDELDLHIAHMKTQRAALIRAPQPAIAFGGRRIAWMYVQQKLLVEYLERPAKPE
jgi:methylmalonyl-CoA/ethylmalonyl-CoA epimerase